MQLLISHKGEHDPGSLKKQQERADNTPGGWKWEEAGLGELPAGCAQRAGCSLPDTWGVGTQLRG